VACVSRLACGPRGPDRGFRGALGSEGLGIIRQVPWPARIPYLLAVLAAFWHVLPKAWLAARRLRPGHKPADDDRRGRAIGIGEWFEAATVAFLFALSLALESWSVDRARRAVAALMELAPSVAHLRLPDGAEVDVTPQEVRRGSC